MIRDIFPTPIGFYKLGGEVTTEEHEFLKNQKTYVNVGNLTSLDTKILNNPELQRIKNFVELSTLEYLKTIWNPKTEINLRITQSWSNYTSKEQFHHKHFHPNSFLSGVFYVHAKKELDKIYFYKNVYQQIKVQPKEWNIWNSESWWFEIESGDLVLFPSSLEHMVQVVDHDETRISIAFNTFPIGILGEEFEMTQLEIKCLDERPSI